MSDRCVSGQAPACAASMRAGTRPYGLEPVRLFVGGYGTYAGGRRFLLGGDREFSAAHPVRSDVPEGEPVCGLLDSGAFSDRPEARLTSAQALDRQLRWERSAAKKWGRPGWRASWLVSYDRLIDETWVAGQRHKRRWSVAEAETAVSETVEAAAYLASQRERLAPRELVLSCQGVDAGQYAECVRAVVSVSTSADVIGLGGWCILGRWKSWMPTFWATLWRVVPEIAAAGVSRIHIFGVLYQPALGGLLWLADQHGLTVSTDSSAPVLSAVYSSTRARKKAGCLAPDGDWETNTRLHVQRLAELRASPYYVCPPRVEAARQLVLLAS